MARRGFSVRITDEAYEGWVAIAAAEGVSITALVEAMGERFAAVKLGGSLSGAGEEVVVRAREIDQRHRSRRR